MSDLGSHQLALSQSAGPWRRLGAMLYDTLALIAVLMLSTLPFLPLARDKVLAPAEVGMLAYGYWIWQLVVIALYFTLFWRRKACTVGMQAWRLRIMGAGGRVAWSESLARLGWASVPWLPSFITLAMAEHFGIVLLRDIGLALLALGFANYFCAYLDAERRAWHDRFLTTRIVRQ